LKDSDNYYTPNTPEQPILELVEKVIGGIDLDPCTDHRSLVDARTKWTITDDCLTKEDWRYYSVTGEKVASSVFMNPPFSNPLPFLEALVNQYKRHHITQAIVLLKLGTLSNRGTGRIIKDFASAVCIWGCTTGRIAFMTYDYDSGQLYQKFGADFDCCLIYFGDNRAMFDSVFSDYGNVLVPYW